ncbi:ATP-binding protein [uncultured Brevundimonas sp.]|uniref:ATP-binding protein n=1 Tax=uncultured Brevundimonas sp. TaxID=213418 RepID=UPI0026195D30|nr:ATP-binding protein [uncultured Brevundimonas sp.]
MALASDSTQTHPYGWSNAIASRHRTISHRVCAAAAAAVVTAPIIGIAPILGWLCAYLVVLLMERYVIRTQFAQGDSGPRGLRGFLYDSILFTSSTTFAWMALPLWYVGGVYGGICAVIYLAAGIVQSVTHGASSLRVVALTATPCAVTLLAAPFFVRQLGADQNTMLAVGTACVVFLGICQVAARRQHEADRAQRQAYELAERKRIEAEAAVTARTNLLATIAHELRTPITAITTGADSLQHDLSAGGRQQLALISDAGKMMNSLLNDLLDQARINAGRLTLSAQPFDLRRMIAQTVRLWHPAIRAKGLKLRLETQRDLPRALIGDEMRLRQVLNNLISNALKFTTEGTITLRTSSFRDEAENLALIIEIEDTGSGMSEDQLARLFTPFEQVSADPSAMQGGSGLGLSICRDLMRLMDGRLTARSQSGRGTIFTVAVTLPEAEASALPVQAPERAAPYIPRIVPVEAIQTPAQVQAPAPTAAPVAAPDPAPAPVSAETAENDSLNDTPLRVLVVDDHEINRRAIQLILQSFDCDISMAADGRTALELASHTPFDVIFMDVRMPELDGRETTRRLRKAGGPNASTPVIAVTADNAPEDQMACAAAGMTAYLSKPLTPASLIATLQATLEKAEQQAAA